MVNADAQTYGQTLTDLSNLHSEYPPFRPWQEKSEPVPVVVAGTPVYRHAGRVRRLRLFTGIPDSRYTGTAMHNAGIPAVEILAHVPALSCGFETPPVLHAGKPVVRHTGIDAG